MQLDDRQKASSTQQIDTTQFKFIVALCRPSPREWRSDFCLFRLFDHFERETSFLPPFPCSQAIGQISRCLGEIVRAVIAMALTARLVLVLRVLANLIIALIVIATLAAIAIIMKNSSSSARHGSSNTSDRNTNNN